MSADLKCCLTCTYWSNIEPPIATGIRRAVGADPDIGTCHAACPTVVRIAGILTSQFPQVHGSRGCGSWEPVDGDGPKGGERVPTSGDVIPFRAIA